MRKEMMCTLYEKIEKENKRLTNKINEIQKQLKTMPKGEIQCVRDGDFLRWYLKESGKRTYISKKKRGLAEKLVAKKYLSTLLKSLKQEKIAIEFYLRHHKANLAEQFLDSSSPYYKLLIPFFNSSNNNYQKWATENYEKNMNYPEQLIYKASSGNFVRSKSEMMIDMYLYMNKIPFRYECALQLGELVIYPDFTTRHPITGEIYYWEHFGMMDDPKYCRNACTKIQTYASNGIIPSVHLIMTFETKEQPLSLEMIEEIIEYYFK